MLAIKMLMNPAMGFAGAPTIPGFYGTVNPPAINQLPVARGTSFAGVDSITKDFTNNQMTINQNQSKATIDWEKFDIGAKATVYFKQQKDGVAQKDWTALNRIYDSNPSQIFGTLKADGKVFLINRNGILFGAGSQVNVHTLVASSLAMTDEDFNNGLLRFKADDGSTPGAVSNSGTITTDNFGSVYLIAPNVENYGSIDAIYGQIGLLAGNDVELAADPNIASGSSSRWALIAKINDTSGVALNHASGRMNADSGMIGMYGASVQQEGIIRAVTAIKRNGQIELLARDRIVTSAGSSTSTPITDSSETVAVNTADTTATFSTGSILLGGLEGGISTVKHIEHYGAITAPSGTVTLNADERVYLDSGSGIDVSGVWTDKEAKDAEVSSQLTSVVLRDSYNQKNGIAKGGAVTVNSLNGSSFGDLSGAVTSRQMTALDRSTAGGTIAVNVKNGDLIADEGSVLNITGGGTRYADGNMSVTKLVSGTTVYDISSAPENLTYDLMLGSFKKTSSKFGVVGSWSGVYLGGGNAINDYSHGFTEGSNAGSLTLQAGSIALNSTIRGGVERGFYQTLSAEQVDAYGLQKTSGLLEPTAGTLVIGAAGNAPGNDDMKADLVTRQVVLAADTVPLAAGFDPENTPVDATRTTVLSTRILNGADLSNLSIYANTSITTEKGASIVLRPSGSFTAMARRIEHNCDISVPSGKVTLIAADNATTYQDNPDKDFDAGYSSKVYLATGSSISVAGERVDNLLAGKVDGYALTPAHLKGGTITVEDASYSNDGTTINGRGLVVNQGAVLDVSGGYSIDIGGKLTGGDAGSIILQGAALVANGHFRGFSLPGRKGGTISLSADNVQVMTALPAVLSQDFKTTTPTPEMSANGAGNSTEYLLIAGNRFDDSGFTNITLKSRNNLTVDSGVIIAPSQKKLLEVTGGGSSYSSPVASNLNETVSGRIGSDGSVTFNEVGASSITLLSGQNLIGDDYNVTTNDSASVTIAADSELRVAPGGGTINVKGPAVTIAGSLYAPSGAVSVTATKLDLVVGSVANISAAGFTMPDTTVVAKGITAGYNPLDAGTINLAANNGSLRLEEGSLVDVSGSKQVTVASANGTASPTISEVASNPGTVNISYLNEFSNEGTFNAGRFQDNLSGGTLSINRKGVDKGIVVSGDLINSYLNSGFDSLTFQSSLAVDLSGSMDISIRRGLTLDAPKITGSGADTVKIKAPWIKIANSATDQPAATVESGGQATLTLDSKWLDLEGDVALNGFATADLAAERDIRLADRQYTPSNASYWSGRLATAGDLTLTADRIYPKMTLSTFSDSIGTTQLVSIPTDFSISVGGKLTTLPSADPTRGLPVYSAGGSLTINAAGGFEHNGTIVVPLGSITINDNPAMAASSRVFLAKGSLLSTAGSTDVIYGFLDDNSSMRTKDKISESNISGNAVSGAPEKNITINGNELIVKEGATIDISGGGSVTAYSFQAGVEGSVNPFTVKGRMVIVPRDLYDLPGEAVYLNGGNGLQAGVYSILPASYAFLPGAYMITDTGATKPGGTYQTIDGASVVSGYSTVAVTNGYTSSNQFHYYSVRAASDLRQEGNFTTVSKDGTDAGLLAIYTNTTILNGSIASATPAGAKGGALIFGGEKLTVQTDVTPLPSDFGFDTDLSMVNPDLVGTLQIKSDSLVGKGLRAITLGTDSTKQITLTDGSTLIAQEITLQTSSAADSEINIGKRVSIRAGENRETGSDGSISYSGDTVVISSGGTVNIGSASEVFAGNELTLTAGKLLLNGALKGASSTLNVNGATLILGTDTATDGLALGNGFFSALSGFTSMQLSSGSDIRIRNDFNLAVSDTLRIDAARIVTDAVKPVSVTFSGSKFELLNSGATPGSDVPAAGGTLTFKGESGWIGNGDVAITGFGTTKFAVTNDIAFLGKGKLTVNGNLDITAAKITAGPYQTQTASSQLNYQAANFVVDSGSGALTLGSSGISSTAITTGYLGGSLSFSGRTIKSSASIELPVGRVSLTATGSAQGEGVTLLNGGSISAQGHDYQAATDGGVEHEAGGVVTLRADNGLVKVDKGAVIDVSAPGAGDAGSIVLIAPEKGVTLNGDIKGNSTQGGLGGSLAIDSLSLDGVGELDGLSSTLATRSLNDKTLAGGFNNQINIRSRSGDLTLSDVKDTNGQQIAALKGRAIEVTADKGALTIKGLIDADTTNGSGRIELNAGKSLNLEDGSKLSARGTDAGANGGTVILSSQDGSNNESIADSKAFNGTYALNVKNGSIIDVSGNGGTGGKVDFRAYQGKANSGDTTLNDVNMAAIDGTINGASRVSVEAARSYTFAGNIGAQDAYMNDASMFMETKDALDNSNAFNIKTRLFGTSSDPNYHLQAGIELYSAGDLTLNTAWDLSSVRPGGEPGVLTLRAANNLTINSKLVDHPTSRNSLPGLDLTSRTSWGLNLIAGAYLAGSDLMSVRQGSGTLTIDGHNGTLVYTESGPIRFASGGNTVLGKGSAADYMINGDLAYTLASYSGSIRGMTGGSLNVNGGAIETATGDITLDVNVGPESFSDQHSRLHPHHRVPRRV